MIRISVLGATGKVGTELVHLISHSPEVTLAELISGSGSGGSVPLGSANPGAAQVIIDFSTPRASMALLDRLHGCETALVIGTTGFSLQQHARLQAEGTRRPILVGANFTKGFEDFAAAARRLARALPEAVVTVGEIYNAQKKMAASGTTERLRTELARETGREVTLDIQRIGDTPGVNTVVLDYGIATVRIELSVRRRAAYAAGALDAAIWLMSRPVGFYCPQDLLLS